MKFLPSIFLIVIWATSLPARGEAQFTDKKTGLAYPTAIGPALFQEERTYDDPRLGYSLRYTSDDWYRFDVYYYDKGMNTIPEGCESPLVATEMKQVLAEIRMMEKDGYYNQVSLLESGIRPEGSGNKGFQWMRISLREKRRSGEWTGRFSETYLRGYKNGFLKIRLTYHSDHRTEGEELSKEIAGTFFKLINDGVKAPSLN